MYLEGLICQKQNSQCNRNFEKCTKNKQPELIASVKSLNMRFINKDIINSGIGRGGLFRIS